MYVFYLFGDLKLLLVDKWMFTCYKCKNLNIDTIKCPKKLAKLNFYNGRCSVKLKTK